MNIEKIRQAQIKAAEDAVCADLKSKGMLNWLEEANRKFAEKGGCPGCGSKLIAVHKLPCSVLENDLY